MKINLANKTGKIAGRVVSASKAAPTKTRTGLVSIKNQFQDGFTAGVNRAS